MISFARKLVRLAPGEPNPSTIDHLPDGYRLETDAEFRARIKPILLEHKIVMATLVIGLMPLFAWWFCTGFIKGAWSEATRKSDPDKLEGS
jgi:hypothetical protein